MSTLNGATRGDPARQPDLTGGEIPDTQSQLEDILDEVWRSEANWRLDDRLDLAAQTRWRPNGR